jgi:ABC-type multidrug transport system permease subunit
VVNNASFIVIFPLTFIANTFVPTENFPGALKAFSNWNPVSALALATRQLFGNTNEAFPAPDSWPLQNAILVSVIWILVILAIFIPLAISRYKKAAAR